MHPTPSEQLQAAQQLIQRAQAGSELPADSVQLLTEATRLLRRLERSWSKRMPFLIDDNRRALRLLGELRPRLPLLVEEISTAAAHPPSDSEEVAQNLNLELQGLLARAVNALPDDADGDEGRARIAEHLRYRLGADPALNRQPVERPTIEGESPEH